MGRKQIYANSAERQRAYRQRKARQKRNAFALRNAAQYLTVQRPPVRYPGGKWKLSTWIIDQFPPHECYVEPFGGGASVLLRKPPAPFEVYNDLDSEAVNFFDMLRARPEDLLRAIELTPYSREMQQRAFEPARDPLERALRFYIRCWQSFQAAPGDHDTGWRFQRDNARGSSVVLQDWNRTDHLWAVAARMKLVQIEHADALAVIRRFDAPGTLFYVDPPYVHDTRARRDLYAHEMSDADHRRLAEALHQVEGLVIVSGYASPLYDTLYPGWQRREKTATTNGNNQAVESLWLSPRAVSLGVLPLFVDHEPGERKDDT